GRGAPRGAPWKAGTPFRGRGPLGGGAYFPLHAVGDATAWLSRQWPDPVAAVIAQQVSEPYEEQQIRATMRRLTEIDDRVSVLVRQQYEENPYPRWMKVPTGAKRVTVDEHLEAGF